MATRRWRNCWRRSNATLKALAGDVRPPRRKPGRRRTEQHLLGLDQRADRAGGAVRGGRQIVRLVLNRGTGFLLQSGEESERFRAAGAAHLRFRRERTADAGAFRPAEKTATELRVEMNARHARRFPLRHSRNRRGNRRGDAARPASGAAFYRDVRICRHVIPYMPARKMQGIQRGGTADTAGKCRMPGRSEVGFSFPPPGVFSKPGRYVRQVPSSGSVLPRFRQKRSFH